jgi:hypothetical protein
MQFRAAAFYSINRRYTVISVHAALNAVTGLSGPLDCVSINITGGYFPISNNEVNIMADQWTLHGIEFSNCNCAYGCPCQFGSPSTHGFCEAVGSLSIDQGNFNDISLDGLKCVFMYHWPGEIAEGNGRQQVIIDERADDSQREALNKIAHGESTTPGTTHFYIFSSTMSEVLETLYLPIDMQIDIEARKATTIIEGLVDSRGTPIKDPFSGEDIRAGIHLPEGFEFTYAEMGSGTSKVGGAIALDLNESYGQFSELHMNQDGVIR